MRTSGRDDPVNGDPFELDNGYPDLAVSDPNRLADLQDLAYNYSQCAGDTCRVYDSQSI